MLKVEVRVNFHCDDIIEDILSIEIIELNLSTSTDSKLKLLN